MTRAAMAAVLARATGRTADDVLREWDGAPPAAPRAVRAAAPPPKRKRARRQTAAKRATARGEAHRARVRGLGAPGYDPTDWDAHVWSGARAMYRDPARCVAMLAELPRPMAIRIRRAALDLVRQDDGTWRARRTWASVRARTIAAAGWAMYRQARCSRKPGAVRVLAGVSHGMIGALFHRADGCTTYSAGYMRATQAGRDGRPGPVAALRLGGVFVAVQPPATVTPQHAGPCRAGKDGRVWRYAFAQYRWDALALDPHGVGVSVHDDDAIIEASRQASGAPPPE